MWVQIADREPSPRVILGKAPGRLMVEFYTSAFGHSNSWKLDLYQRSDPLQWASTGPRNRIYQLTRTGVYRLISEGRFEFITLTLGSLLSKEDHYNLAIRPRDAGGFGISWPLRLEGLKLTSLKKPWDNNKDLAPQAGDSRPTIWDRIDDESTLG